MYGIKFTEINLGLSFLREMHGKFVVEHGRVRTKHSAARARAQQLWVRTRLVEQGIDVSEYRGYHVEPGTVSTAVYFGRN